MAESVVTSKSIGPKHVAVIMDGNGRWARKRGLPRSVGHKKGAEAAKRIVEYAVDHDVQYLTLFGFSSENWARPEAEIVELMKLLRHYLRSQMAEFHKKNARLSVIGDRSAFDSDIVELIENAEALTNGNDAIHVIIALNYGGRQDIVQAVERLLDEGRVNNIEQAIADGLMTAGVPDPDLLIRTSGEQRISNFLLWQCAYSEMFFTSTLWPDFSEKDFREALDEYAGRDRRFGAVKAL